jgi:hypothetical protein
MITEAELPGAIARLRGMAAEAEMKRQWAASMCSIPKEYLYQGERKGLLEALDLLQHNGHGEAPSTKKEVVMGNGCE